MIHVALYEPEIPPNTGNIIRLCANTGAKLHLVGKLGFEMDDARLRRAGLDYHEHAEIQYHQDLDDLLHALPSARLFGFSAHGQTRYDEIDYCQGDVLLFGPETRGLSREWLAELPAGQSVYIPQQPHSRSLNLSNAVAVATYETWRRLRFA